MSGVLAFRENSNENEEGIEEAEYGVLGEEERGKGTDEGNRNSAGNRWPREETLALLKIRSDMDVEFRDSGHKGPLWEEVSRRLSEFGFRRNAKKCKEKFENIDKYYRRTKEGKSGRPNGKNYRFFEQLERLHHNPLLPSNPQLSLPPPPPDNGTHINSSIDVTSIAMAIDPINFFQEGSILYGMQNPIRETNMTASTSTNSTSSEGGISKKMKRKRKYSEFFDRILREVTEKQENLQKRFVEAIERYERNRIEREEAWRIQEMARMKREQEMLVQERAIAAAKDAAVMAFLQKFSQQEIPVQLPENPIPLSGERNAENQENGNGDKHNNVQTSSSRWPKSEVEALINIRSAFGQQYQENGPKGSLWEEISSAMKKLGYDRSAKRCKEKWENINKYFKRVRDSNKKRSEDSRTCPYFHQLNSLYNKEKNINDTKTGSEEIGKDAETVDGNLGGNDADNEGEEEDEEEDGDSYQIVVNDTSSVKVMR